MTTYNPIIPQSGDNLSTSQGDILGNFTELNNQFAIDHIAFNTGSGNGTGFHKKITFSDVLATPSPSSPASVLYTKTVTLSATPTQCLFYKNAQLSEIRLTGITSAATTGYATLAGALILAWGTASSIADNGTVTVSVLTTLYQVTFVIEDSSGGTITSRAYLKSTSTNTFTIRTSGSAVTLRYIAIGV